MCPSTAQGAPPSLALTFPPQGPSASLPIQPQVGSPGVTHLALSLKEMSEVPGGEFRTFWEPEYKTSIPVERRGTCSWGGPTPPRAGSWQVPSEARWTVLSDSVLDLFDLTLCPGRLGSIAGHLLAVGWV